MGDRNIKNDAGNNKKLVFYSLDNESLKKIHIYEGGVSAGFPSPADDYLDDDLNLHTHLVKNPASTFFIKVKGHSMDNAGMSDGDILVVDKSLDPKSSDIVLAVVNGEFTVKRYIDSNGRYLRAESKLNTYPDIQIDSDTDIEIWGVVTHTIHSNR